MFRPCIDLHEGKVKQIVGGTLGDSGLRTNFVSDRSAAWFADLYRRDGLTGGHVFHGELALDQFFTMRPLLDWARYHTPIDRLFLCGNGTHPGTGLTGGSGANSARVILKSLKK